MQFDTRMLDERRFVDFHFSSVVLSWAVRPHSTAELYNWTETHNYTQFSSVHIHN